MKVIIDIPKKLYDRYKLKDHIKRCDIVEFEKALDNCIILPKGHGRIGDIDELYNAFKKACDAYNIDNLSFISEVDMNFDLALAILEADRGE